MIHIFWDMDELFNETGLSLERLRSFCLIAEHGGITKAARGDSTKQPLFSRQLKELEGFFGTELVRRSGKSIVLTEEGQTLHRLVRDYFTALSDFKRSCTGKPTHIRVGAGDSVIQWLILPKLGQTRSSLPSVSLTLLNLPTKEIIEKLESGEIDLGVVRSDAISAQLKSKALGRMDFAFFVPKKMVGKASADWRSVLKVCPLAVLEGSGSFRHELQRVAAAEGCEPRIELECSSFPAVARAVRSGNLAAILPAAATDELPKDEFISITAPWLTKLSRPISISWNPRTILIRREIEDVYPVVTKIWTSR